MLFKDKIDTGIDSNPKELKRARELGRYNELIACQGDAVLKSDNSYNTIFSNSVLEHIQNLALVFQEIHRLLAPGGRFYFTVPSNFFDQYTIGKTLLTTIGLPATAKCYRKFSIIFGVTIIIICCPNGKNSFCSMILKSLMLLLTILANFVFLTIFWYLYSLPEFVAKKGRSSPRFGDT
jgi:SAM-dependent methyltransferase